MALLRTAIRAGVAIVCYAAGRSGHFFIAAAIALLWLFWNRLSRTVILWITARLPAKIIRGPEGAPFLERYHLWQGSSGVGVVLHRFVRSDPDRGLHNHPWRWSFSVILCGGYTELYMPHASASLSERHVRVFRPGDINWVDPGAFHRVLLGALAAPYCASPPEDAWTLFVYGPRSQGFGFLNTPRGHAYDQKPSTDATHYSRSGVVSAEARAQEAPFACPSNELEFRPFTTSLVPKDAMWPLTAPRGAAARLSGAARASVY